MFGIRTAMCYLEIIEITIMYERRPMVQKCNVLIVYEYNNSHPVNSSQYGTTFTTACPAEGVKPS